MTQDGPVAAPIDGRAPDFDPNNAVPLRLVLPEGTTGWIALPPATYVIEETLEVARVQLTAPDSYFVHRSTLVAYERCRSAGDLVGVHSFGDGEAARST